MAKPLNQVMFFKASNPFASTQPMENVVKALAIVCGKENVRIIDSQNKVFDIKENKSDKQLIFDLSKIW